MERYLLFGFDRFYPSGGLNDLLTKFDDTSSLALTFKDSTYELECQYYQILDTVTGESKGFSLYDKIEEYEETHGDIDYYGAENDVKIKLIISFILDSMK